MLICKKQPGLLNKKGLNLDHATNTPFALLLQWSWKNRLVSLIEHFPCRDVLGTTLNNLSQLSHTFKLPTLFFSPSTSPLFMVRTAVHWSSCKSALFFAVD